MMACFDIFPTLHKQGQPLTCGMIGIAEMLCRQPSFLALLLVDRCYAGGLLTGLFGK